jgi:hypothetical protein
MATLEELEQRLAAVEGELALLGRFVFGPPDGETPAERCQWLLRQARLVQPSLAEGWTRALREMGVEGEPVGVEKLRQMFLDSGIDPEANEFSRRIQEMRGR